MLPENIVKGKKYLVKFPEGNRALRLHYKSDFYHKGNGPFWYFIFYTLDGKGFHYVKTHKRVLQVLDEDYTENKC